MLTATIARFQRALFFGRMILAGALIAAVLIVALAAPAATASAAPAAPTCSNTITVMNGNDSGAGSLRQAIADVCAGGTIYFDHDMTVTLASMIVIDKGLTIEGQETDVTISGNRATRIFFILAEAIAVHLNRLTIADGWSPNATRGGGIRNYGSLYCRILHAHQQRHRRRWWGDLQHRQRHPLRQKQHADEQPGRREWRGHLRFDRLHSGAQECHHHRQRGHSSRGRVAR